MKKRSWMVVFGLVFVVAALGFGAYALLSSQNEASGEFSFLQSPLVPLMIVAVPLALIAVVAALICKRED
jgi:hypothetical protein